ncbi:hypothetical protein [uncultured Faecalibaculum sp.]|uniref:hypothetical protein n=1 Tax=uncultured Faecalibaculum sp. TaxID=1729681 RepID=UPI00262A952C|nr:hypothetical protein [uncultured Faecalibaculum sp.]
MDIRKEQSDLRFEFDKRGCRKLMQKHASLQDSVEQTISRQAENDFFKTKYATRNKWKGLPVLECRVNDPAAGAVRAAFTRQGNEIQVVFLTRTLLKKDFTQELESFLKGAWA